MRLDNIAELVQVEGGHDIGCETGKDGERDETLEAYISGQYIFA